MKKHIALALLAMAIGTPVLAKTGDEKETKKAEKKDVKVKEVKEKKETKKSESEGEEEKKASDTEKADKDEKKVEKKKKEEVEVEEKDGKKVEKKKTKETQETEETKTEGVGFFGQFKSTDNFKEYLSTTKGKVVDGLLAAGIVYAAWNHKKIAAYLFGTGECPQDGDVSAAA